MSLRIYMCIYMLYFIKSYICTHIYIHDLMNSHKLNALPFDLLTTVLSHHLLPELNVISSERPPLTSQCRVSSHFHHSVSWSVVFEIFARDLWSQAVFIKILSFFVFLSSFSYECTMEFIPLMAINRMGAWVFLCFKFFCFLFLIH